jgi:hypothetical protein
LLQRAIAITFFVPSVLFFILIFLIDRKFYRIIHQQFRRQDKELSEYLSATLAYYINLKTGSNGGSSISTRAKIDVLTEIIKEIYQ